MSNPIDSAEEAILSAATSAAEVGVPLEDALALVKSSYRARGANGGR